MLCLYVQWLSCSNTFIRVGLEISHNYVTFEVSTVVLLGIHGFWDMTLCCQVSVSKTKILLGLLNP